MSLRAFPGISENFLQNAYKTQQRQTLLCLPCLPLKVMRLC